MLSTLGFYYYFNFISENYSLSQYAEASRKIAIANDILTTNITADTLKVNKIPDLQKQFQEQKNEIDTVEKNLSHNRPLAKYTEQHKIFVDLLNKESSILEKTCLIITKPLDNGTDDVITSLKDNIDKTKSLASRIQLPNNDFVLSNICLSSPIT